MSRRFFPKRGSHKTKYLDRMMYIQSLTTISPLCHIEVMPSKLLLRDYQPGAYYHLKHTAKKGTSLFNNDKDFQTFTLLLSYYLRFPDATPLSWVKRMNPKTVVAKRDASNLGSTPTTLHAFLLLPGEFHLLLRENLGGKKPGISNLMRRLSVGYAMYYNKEYACTGTIYQGKYKNYLVPNSDLISTLTSIHTPAGVNTTYLSSPLHSSLFDYTNNARSWISLLPLA